MELNLPCNAWAIWPGITISPLVGSLLENLLGCLHQDDPPPHTVVHYRAGDLNVPQLKQGSLALG